MPAPWSGGVDGQPLQVAARAGPPRDGVADDRAAGVGADGDPQPRRRGGGQRVDEPGGVEPPEGRERRARRRPGSAAGRRGGRAAARSAGGRAREVVEGADQEVEALVDLEAGVEEGALLGGGRAAVRATP